MSGLNIGLPSPWLVPGIYLSLNFAQGASIATAGERTVLFVMPKLSSGTFQSNQIVRVKTESDVETGAGAGSPLHRALRVYFQATKRGTVYVLPYSATSGLGVDSADGYFDIDGTATANGILEAYVAGEVFRVNFSVGQDGSDIGDILEAKINAATWLPVTANNSSGTVTLTAKLAGESQNGIIRIRASILSGSGISVATSGDTLTGGAEGAVTEETNLDNALDVIQQEYYFLGISLNTENALTLLKSKIVNDADPLTGNRQVGVAASTEAKSAIQAKAVAKNFERLQIVGHPYADNTPDEIVGQMLALRSRKENASSDSNFNVFRGDSEVNWILKPVSDQSLWLDKEDRNEMLVDGVTPIAQDKNGSFLVKSVTTKSKDATGLVADGRVRSTHIVSVTDDFARTLENRHMALYAGNGYKLKDDMRDQNGNIDPEQVIPPRTVTPSRWKGLPLQLIQEFYDSGKIKDLTETKSAVDVQISDENTERLECGINLKVTPLFDQVTIRINEVSPG